MNTKLSCTSSHVANSSPAEPMRAAEKELAAFFNAVAQLFGKEQADRSAEEWLSQLIELDALPSSTRGWRAITIRALDRLAARLGSATLSAELSNI